MNREQMIEDHGGVAAMTNYPTWAYSAAELHALERTGDKLPDETWHAVSDPDDEDAMRGEEREVLRPLFGGECD